MDIVKAQSLVLLVIFCGVVAAGGAGPGRADAGHGPDRVVAPNLIAQNAPLSKRVDSFTMAPVGGAVGGKPSDTTIGWIDVRLMGAKGDGSTDDTQAFRDALALAERDGGGTIFVPSGDYLIADGPLDVGSGVIVQGVSSKSAKLFDSEMGGGLFSIRDEASRFAFRSLFLVASGGHVWTSEGCCSQGHILDVVAWSYGAGHSVWHHDNDGSFVGMLVEHSEFTAYGPKEVPAWYLRAPGGINANTFFRCTLNADDDVDDYFFHVEVTGEDRYAYDNAFRDLVFELTNGGEIRLLSHNGALIENCHGYDYHHRGEIFRDLIVIDSAAGGNASENVMIINSGRRGGTLADGVYDLRIGNAERTVADNLAAVPRTGLRIHAGSSRTTRLRNVHPDALIDGFVGPVTTSDGGPAPRKVTDDTLLGLEHNIVFADAGSGDLVLTLPDGVSAKEYQIIKQGDDNSVTLATFDAANRFADNTVEQVLVDDGDALCTATVGDRLWRFLPCAR